MDFILSPHAEEGLEERKISREMINSALQNPEQIIPEHSRRKAYQSRFKTGDGGLFLLRVIV